MCVKITDCESRQFFSQVLFSSINNLQLILTALCWGNNTGGMLGAAILLCSG